MFEHSENSRIAEAAAPAIALGVSVVICCHNSAKLLPPTLEHLHAQQVDPSIPWEVIVVDNASTDATAEIARKLWPDDAPAPLRVVAEPQLGLSNARRRGFAEAKYEIVSFVDDDNWVANDWITVASEALSCDPKIGAVGSLNYPACEIEPPPWFERYHGYYAVLTEKDLESVCQPITLLIGAGLTIRKRAWLKLLDAGFRQHLTDRVGRRLTSGGDLEMTLALQMAGWELRVEPRLKLQHFIPAQRLQWNYLRQMMRTSAASMVALDAYYHLVGYAERRSHIDWLRQRWWWHLRAPLFALAREPSKVLAAMLTAGESDLGIIEVEMKIGRVIGLFHLKGRYAAIRRAVRAAKWRKPSPETADSEIVRP